MIENENQYIITKNKLQEFSKSLENLRVGEKNDLLNQIMKDSINSQIEIFTREIKDYEKRSAN